MEQLVIVLAILVGVLIYQVRRMRSGVTGIENELRCLGDDIRRLREGARHPVPAARPEPDVKPAPTPAPAPVPVPSPVPPPLPSLAARRAEPLAAAVAASAVPTSPATAPQDEAADPPPPPSRFVQSVGDILGRIWQWILVGEEFRPAGVALEYAIATTWLMRAGIVALVACAAYFLKWSMDHGLLSPPARVGISILFGLGMLTGGMRLLGRRWNVLGQGFVGGGLAVLYFSMYALGPRYHIVPSQAVVFALMGLVTLGAGVLALSANSMLVAILGIVGGFFTPALLSTGEPRFLALYSYLLLLNVGVLGLATLRPWRLLNYLSFALTYFLYFGSIGSYRLEHFPVAITFLSLFFVVHSLVVVLYNLRRRENATGLDIVHLVLNGLIFASAAYVRIHEAAGRPWPAVMTLALALFFVAQVGAFLGRGLRDRALLLCLVSLAAFFTVMTMPLAMEKESLTMAWALMGLMFLWLGRRLDSNFMRLLGYLMYGITFWRVLFFELPRVELRLAADASLADYWKTAGNRLWTFAVTLGSIAAAFAVERRAPTSAAARPEARPNDIPDAVPGGVARVVFFWSIAILLFLYLHLELQALFGLFAPLRPAVLTLLWCGMAAFFLHRYLGTGSTAALVAMAAFAAGAMLKTLCWDFVVWDLSPRFVFGAPYTGASVCLRWLDLAWVLALFAVVWRLVSLRRPLPALPQVFGYGTLALLWLYSTLEVNTLLHWKAKDFEAIGVSVLWTVFALAFVAGGIWRNVRPIRYAGLALFAVVVVKVLFVDLSHTPVILRALAFMAFGVLLLLGSFAYLRANRRFTSGPASEGG